MATKKKATRRARTTAGGRTQQGTGIVNEDAIERAAPPMGYAAEGSEQEETGGDFSTSSREDQSMDQTTSNLSTVVRDQARSVAAFVTTQIQEHPVRSLTVVGAASFLLASRARVIPALLRSGLGIAVAVMLRRLAERTTMDTAAAE